MRVTGKAPTTKAGWIAVLCAYWFLTVATTLATIYIAPPNRQPMLALVSVIFWIVSLRSVLQFNAWTKRKPR